MTSPLLRLFAVFWWLLVIGSLAAAVWLYKTAWDDLADQGLTIPSRIIIGAQFDPLLPPHWEYVAVQVLPSLLPYPALTITRWMITARWRFGPRW